MNNNLHKAVILGVADTGYYIIRSLTPYGIPMIGFEKNLSQPECKTKFCDVRKITSFENLLSEMIDLSKAQKVKPILYITSDELVNFYSDNREIINQYYHIDFPSKETVNILLNKDEFSDYATKNNFRIPKTIIIHSQKDIENNENEIIFPCVVKPVWKKSSWKKARFPKIFVFNNIDEYKKRIPKIFSVEKDLIIQEWIPGNDNEIYFTLVYFDHTSKCLAKFTGRKIRQWPVGTGNTSYACPYEDQILEKETIRLFESLSYRGFGSVEYKRNPYNNTYYIMEPTVGRPNHQSYISTANGLNIPVIAYKNLSGINISYKIETTHNVWWVDEQYDLFSILVSIFKRKLTVKDILKLYNKDLVFRVSNKYDLWPGIYLLFWPFFALSKRLKFSKS